MLPCKADGICARADRNRRHFPPKEPHGTNSIGGTTVHIQSTHGTTRSGRDPITLTAGITVAVAHALLLRIALSNHVTVDPVAWAETFGARALGAIHGAGRPLFLAGNAAGAVAGIRVRARRLVRWRSGLAGLALIGGLIVLAARPTSASRARAG